MVIEGVDYSFAPPTAAELQAAGKLFAMRYVPYWGDEGKGLTAAEREALHAAGIAIGVVWESTGGRHLDGGSAGANDARVARDALQRLGFPDDTPVYFAVDFEPTPSQMAAIDNYQHGAISILGSKLVGVYGNDAVCAHCEAFGTATWFWQTYAWSGGRRFSHRNVFQYENGVPLGSGEVDYCQASSFAGMWVPSTNIREEDQPMTPDEKAALAQLQADLKTTREQLFQVATQVFGEDPKFPRGTDEAPYFDATMKTVDDLAKHAGGTIEPTTGTFRITGTITKDG